MTVLTMPAQPGQATAPQPVPWRRMLWVTWRQHRPTLISVPAVLGALALFLVIAGLKVHHDYARLTACLPACQQLNSSFNSTDWTLGNTLNILLDLMPPLVGAFAGAPLLARELETGTYQYAWTQGVGRARWAIAKLVLIAAVVTVLAGAFSELFTWFFQPFIKQEDMTVLTATIFDTRWLVFAAWTLLAFSVGAMLGMLFRRIVPALATTLGVYIGLTIVTWLFLRKHYLPASVTHNASIMTGQLTPNTPWMLSTWYTGPGGKPASQSVVNKILNSAQGAQGALSQGAHGPSGQGGHAPGVTQVLAQHGYTEWWSYLPVSRFWPMQFIEAGWLLALSALLIAATVWLVRHRAA